MSGARAQLLETAERLFSGDADEAEMRQAGLHLLLLPEADGGFGGDWSDAAAVLRLAGFHMAEGAAAIVMQAAPEAEDALRNTAFAVAAQTAGALDRLLQMCIAHASERTQFGRPIGRFQAVQQMLALLAEQAAAVNCAVFGAAEALGAPGAAPDSALLPLAAAKLAANRAAAEGAAIAHQVHGAIGFTAELPLHRWTAALHRWRGEGGNDRFWSERLGRAAAAIGADAYWDWVVRSGQAHS